MVAVFKAASGGEPKTIVLTTPIALPGREPLTEITLRPPRYLDFIEFGEPETWVPLESTPAGGLFQTDYAVVERYVRRLSKLSIHEAASLDLVALPDAMSIRDAVLGFFREAMLATGALTIRGASSPADSSSPTGSPSQASAA